MNPPGSQAPPPTTPQTAPSHPPYPLGRRAGASSGRGPNCSSTSANSARTLVRMSGTASGESL